MSVFQRATKTSARLRMAITGPSGSGKTYTGLTLATHLAALRNAGRVAAIDTEHGSMSKYADLFDFDVLELTDFNPLNYVEALNQAQAAGYRVCLVDSLSHAWVGEGGALDLKDRESLKSGNSFTAWGKVTPLQNRLIDAILSSPMDVIATMRSKVEYVQEGKKVTKVGMAPVQRDGVDYEFDVVGEMSLEHVMSISKTRARVLDGKTFKQPGEALAQQLVAWLEDGVAPALAVAPVAASLPFPTADDVRDVLSGFTAAQSVLLKDALTEAGVEFGTTKGELVFAVCNYVSTDDWLAVVERIRAEPSFPADLPDVQRKPSREKPSAVERRDKDDAKADAEVDALWEKATQDVASVPAYGAGAPS